jgi:hypothetical protein
MQSIATGVVSLALASLLNLIACEGASPRSRPDVRLSASPASVALDTVYVGHVRTYPVAVTNEGGSIAVASASVSSAELTANLHAPMTLERGASAWFTVTYAPSRPGRLQGSITLLDDGGRTILSLPVTAVAVALDSTSCVDVVAFGAKGDGASEDRAAFQAAADAAHLEGKALCVPQPPGGEHYKLTGYVRIYGSVVGEPGPEHPEIRMYGANGAANPGGIEPYTILSYEGNAAGTAITGLHLNGGRDFAPGTHVYGMAEYSHGIALQGVSNLWIEDNLIENTQGDAILVGGAGNIGPCTNVKIIRNVLRHPMRCAVFPGDTQGLRVYLNTISKAVEYQGAIDFEPNHPPQANWDAEVAYNDFDTTLQYDHAVIVSNLATKVSVPAGRLRVHDNWGTPGRYSFFVDLTVPATKRSAHGNSIQRSLAAWR